MNIPVKKLKSGFKMPVYGLGTWQMGGRWEKDPKNDIADINAIKKAIELGVTHIDTAEVYSNGHAEELVGEAIRDCDRKKLFIVSKVYTNHLSYDNVIRSAKSSLKRLQTPYLDLYLTHGYNPDIPIKETMRAMDKLVDEGLIKNVGICNYTKEHIEEARSYAKHKIVAAQIHLNLLIREAEKKGVLKYCQDNDIMFIAWRPVQKGKILEEPMLVEMAKKYRKTPAQIAINWLISQKNVITLSKTTNVEHLKENLGAVGWEMEKEDIEKLRKDFPNQQDISDTVPLE